MGDKIITIEEFAIAGMRCQLLRFNASGITGGYEQVASAMEEIEPQLDLNLPVAIRTERVYDYRYFPGWAVGMLFYAVRRTPLVLISDIDIVTKEWTIVKSDR